jgi:hypothetical protein
MFKSSSMTVIRTLSTILRSPCYEIAGFSGAVATVVGQRLATFRSNARRGKRLYQGVPVALLSFGQQTGRSLRVAYAMITPGRLQMQLVQRS